ncbi:MAG: SpoIIE family protein phosphatase [Phycisphaerae bacterium]|nr:SpoIIE family protein phosphatase [Phycisphaerae bacterium]
MRIVVERGETSILDKRFADRTLYVGRQEACQIRLAADETVSGRHLMILEEEGRWYVEPLHDQLHRSFLNDKPLRGRETLRDRDVLTVGEYKIKVYPSKKDNERFIPVEVVYRSKSEIAETAELDYEDLDLDQTAVVKQRHDTFSLSKGSFDYISSFSSKVASIADPHAILAMAVDSLIEDFQASCVWIGLRTDDEGNLNLSTGRDMAGRVIDAPALARRAQKAVVECGRAVLFPEANHNGEKSAIAAPLMNSSGGMGMVYLENQANRGKFNPSDLDFTVFVASEMATALGRVLYAQWVHSEEVRSAGQEMTRRVQARIVPWQLPQWSGLRMAALMENGSGVCTDFYDVVPWSDKLAMVLIGQISGDEPDSAVLMGELSAGFRIGAVHQDAPAVLTRQLSWMLFSTRNDPRRVNLGVLSLVPQTGEFHLVHVGQVRAYVIDGEGDGKRLESPNEQLVGEARKSKYESVSGKLEEGQALALCTGGLFSLASSDGRLFQESQLLDLLSDSQRESPSTVLGELASELSAFLSGERPSQDVTVLLFRRSAD